MQNYTRWLHNATDLPLEFVVLTPDTSIANAKEQVKNCSGILFTGGEDIDPERYGKAERRSECTINSRRDELEFALFELAVERKLPILGICRGMQLINVALGGALYVDIPTDTPSETEHRRHDSQDAAHSIALVGGSLLFKITNEVEGIINSAHHQGIEQLGRGLSASAYAPDGQIEAIEWESIYGSGFLLGVQWHPERLNWANPFSKNIASHFLFEAECYAALLQKEREKE